MRICILTQPLGTNYGGLLQAYALQRVLRDFGHEVTTLRFKKQIYKAPTKRNLYWQTFRRFLSKYIKGNKSIIRCNPTRQSEYFVEKCRELERFINTKIHHLIVDAPIDINKLPKFDLFLVGSDQVWRPAYSPFLPNFYLDFLNDSMVKRAAYAASFGVDFWETNEDMTAIIKPLAKKFDTISVREESGIKLCKDYLGVDAVLMPDPTLLLRRDDYLKLVQEQGLTPRMDPYIATYVLDPDQNINRLIDNFSEEQHLPVVKLGQFNWTTGADSIESWLAGLAGAKYVITDSFHGTVFSLIFQRDFVAINNPDRGSARFTTLIGLLGLNDRLVSSNTEQIVIDPIDYSQVSPVLAELRMKGISFLEKLPKE